MATIAGIRSDLRKDLLDTDSENYVWTDDELDRYIDHALIEISQVSPRQTTASYTFPAGPTRDVDTEDITGMSSWIAIEAVEYPKGQFPRRFVKFTVWDTIIHLQISKAPAEDDELRVWFMKKHDFTAGVGEDELTLPDHLHELLKIGASGFAATAWGVKATNIVTVGGRSADRDYASWGAERLKFFRSEIERLGKQAVGKQRLFYRE